MDKMYALHCASRNSSGLLSQTLTFLLSSHYDQWYGLTRASSMVLAMNQKELGRFKNQMYINRP